MKSKKLALWMILVLLVGMQPQVMAAQEATDSQVVLDGCANEIRPMATCVNCGDFAYFTCNDDGIYDGTSTHRYNFWTQEYTITWRISTATRRCSWCGYTTLVYSDFSDDPAYHDCYRSHGACGQGIYNTCPVQGWNLGGM